MSVQTSSPISLVGRARRFAASARQEGLRSMLRRLVFHWRCVVGTPGPLAIYTEWLARFDARESGVTDLTKNDIAVVVLIPLASGQHAEAARKALASLVHQTYPRWEAWLVTLGDVATAPNGAAETCLDAVTRVAGPAWISDGPAGTRFFARVLPDDELHPFALSRVGDAVRRRPTVRVVYGDQDGIDQAGRRHSPYFKPDFDFDLLFAQDYLSKGAFVEAGLLEACGGAAALASSPHAAMLDLAASDPDILHLQHIVYHHRSPRQDRPYPGSSPVCGDSSSVARFFAHRAPATVVTAGVDTVRIRWPLPSPAPTVSVIIPIRDRPALLGRCVDGLLHGTEYPDFELLIVDNGSVQRETLDLLETLGRHDRIKVLRHGGAFNFSAINNHAVGQADGTLLLLLNNDIEILDPGWMKELVSQACRPGVGAVGALLLYPDQTIQHAGVVLGLHGVAGHPYAGKPRDFVGQAGRLHCVQSLSAVTGACLMVRKALYHDVGGLDESLPVAFNDVDFCLRLRERGFRTVWTPHARLLHHESVSRGGDEDPQDRERLEREIAILRQRWAHLLQADSAYHPALSLDGEAFEVSLAPRAGGQPR